MCYLSSGNMFEQRKTWSEVRSAGLESLILYSKLRGDDELNSFLQENKSPVKVHDLCRKQYTCKRKYEQEQRAKDSNEKLITPSKKLRSAVDVPFQWKEHCMLCGELAQFDSKHPQNNKISHVETLEIRSTVLNYCSKRSDNWGLEVESRINTCNDLVAVEAIYHRSCYAAFSAMRSKVPKFTTPGGKVCEPKLETFKRLCSWIELCDDELYTMTDLQIKLKDMAFGDESLVYSKMQLKRKLKRKYGDHMFFAEVAGKRNVVCFRNMAACVINDRWYKQQQLEIEDESLRVVTAAAKLIKAQIREMTVDMNKYPATSEFDSVESSLQFVPPLLNAFIKNVVCDDRKQIALSHCLIQAARPRSILARILLGLGVSLDHTFGSEWLLSTLARLGVCVSYDEVNRYKQSVVQSDVDDSPQSYPSSFTQFSGDNVDHQSVTLDGLGGVHWMGMISMTTPISNVINGKFGLPAISRLKRVAVDRLSRKHRVPILTYSTPEIAALSTLELKPVEELQSLIPTSTAECSSSLDLVWHCGFFSKMTLVQDLVGLASCRT